MSNIGYSKYLLERINNLTEYIDKLQTTYVIEDIILSDDTIVQQIAPDETEPETGGTGENTHWLFQKDDETNKKINWYFYGNLNNISLLKTYENIQSFYCIIELDNLSSQPWLTVYTKALGDGNDYSWYRSKFNHNTYPDVNNIPRNEKIIIYMSATNEDVFDIFPHLDISLPALKLTSSANTGPQANDESILSIALSTNSASTYVNLKVYETGYKFNNTYSQITNLQ